MPLKGLMITCVMCGIRYRKMYLNAIRNFDCQDVLVHNEDPSILISFLRDPLYTRL